MFDAICKALRSPQERITVELEESVATDLAKACESGGRERTAEAIRAAIRMVKAKQADDHGASERREAMQVLFEDGELTPKEIEVARRKGLL